MSLRIFFWAAMHHSLFYKCKIRSPFHLRFYSQHRLIGFTGYICIPSICIPRILEEDYFIALGEREEEEAGWGVQIHTDD